MSYDNQRPPPRRPPGDGDQERIGLLLCVLSAVLSLVLFAYLMGWW